MSDAETTVGATVSLQAPSEGETTWTATQVDPAKDLDSGDSQGRLSLEWSYGPVQLSGYVSTDTFALAYSPTIAGINLGTIYGNLKDGVAVNADLKTVKGQIKTYLKNGNEIWNYIDIQIAYNGSYQGDYKIMTF
ncbi:uncharacterized protein B0I36DRAFT_382351 [Microdochium trichocladiopsis]|uniref:Uncharacterized protein n=1 Tax=Microdochium trichocladiopsis TaxID=1682393 RepID=A0A9P8YCT8_9PEZI|nr:uncharacterized protein B0I36DRAFT_382351 [Microdochium trichocladiopsis]KAH7035694.1 hypothetical protein B0I36DRAFT_382351 [Microdochium trichocladiopsis]